MKKLFLIAAIAVCGFAFMSCESEQTPTQIAEKALKCVQDKNYEGYVDLLQLKDSLPADELKKQKEELKVLIGGKMDSQLKEKEGIKEFKVLEETIEDNKAKVKYQITWGNGETTDDNMNLIQDEKGKWKVDGTRK